MREIFKKKELIPVLVLAAASALVLLFIYVFPSGEAVSARVIFDGDVVENIDLSKDAVYHIDALFPVTLEVKDKAIRFVDSVCPNHDCEGFGWIDSPPETAVCLPAKVAVQIVGN